MEDITVVVIENLGSDQQACRTLTERYKKYLYRDTQTQQTLTARFYPLHFDKQSDIVILLDENNNQVEILKISSGILVIVGESTPLYETGVKNIRTILEKTDKDIYEFTNCGLDTTWDLLAGRLLLENHRNATGLFITSHRLQEEYNSEFLEPVDAVSILLDLILVPGAVGIDYADLKSILYKKGSSKQPFFVFRYYLEHIKTFKDTVLPLATPQLKDSIGIASVLSMKESDVLLAFIREQIVEKNSNLLSQTTTITSGKPSVLFAGRID